VCVVCVCVCVRVCVCVCVVRRVLVCASRQMEKIHVDREIATEKSEKERDEKKRGRTPTTIGSMLGNPLRYIWQIICTPASQSAGATHIAGGQLALGPRAGRDGKDISVLRGAREREKEKRDERE
jgi:hypothetical protein